MITDYSPIVGLPMQRRQQGGPASLAIDYTDALIAAGATPLPLPLVPEGALEAALRLADLCDGLLLTGSVADVHPRLYGQEKPEDGYCDERRDALDYALLDYADRMGKPVFGICRGCQVLNVWRGGTLAWHYHQLDDSTQIAHMSKGSVSDAHTVLWEKGSWLAAQMPAAVQPVNSLHRQVCARVAPGMRIAAVSEDGFVEAIEDAAHPDRCFAVQWHPEILAMRGDPVAQSLIRRFVSSCREWRQQAEESVKFSSLRIPAHV